MPLEILGPLVVLGILGIAALLHLSGHSAVAPLTQARALSDWTGHYPDTQVRSAELSKDAQAALIQSDQGPGLIWTLGADTTARLFTSPPELSNTHTGLIVRTNDFTAPKLRVVLDDDAARARWTDTLLQTGQG